MQESLETLHPLESPQSCSVSACPWWLAFILVILTVCAWGFAGVSTYVGSTRTLQIAADFDVPLSPLPYAILVYGGLLLPIATVIGVAIAGVARSTRGLWMVLLGVPLVMAAMQFAVQFLFIQGQIERLS